jgi:hypothetical protein
MDDTSAGTNSLAGMTTLPDFAQSQKDQAATSGPGTSGSTATLEENGGGPGPSSTSRSDGANGAATSGNKGKGKEVSFVTPQLSNISRMCVASFPSWMYR